MAPSPPPPTAGIIPIQDFARDLWEAMRRDLREQLTAVTDGDFQAQFPPWEKLSAEVQQSKITIARDELLAILDRAGYQVRRKKLPLAEDKAKV